MVYVAILLTGLYAAARARKLTSPRKSERSSFLYSASLGVFCCVLAVAVQGFTTGLAHREVVYVFVTMAICVRILAEKDQETANESGLRKKVRTSGAVVENGEAITI